MMVKEIVFVIIVLATQLGGVLGCDQPLMKQTDHTPTKEFLLTQNADGPLVAKVNGYPIFQTDLQQLIDEADAGMSSREGLDLLIQEQLLAQEAQQKGFGNHKTVITEKQKALAKALFATIKRKVTPKDLELSVLKEIYQKQHNRFVHSNRFTVIHAVVKTGPKYLTHLAAQNIAKEIAAATKGVKTEKRFKEIADTFKTRHPEEITIEKLSPFTKESSTLVKAFVDNVTAVSQTGSLVGPFVTAFGWHVVFIIDVAPAQNISFNEARPIIEQEYLPIAQSAAAKSMMDDLVKKGNVIIMEGELDALQRTQ